MSNRISDFYDGIPDWVRLFHDEQPIDLLESIIEGTPMNLFYANEFGRRKHKWVVEVVHPPETRHLVAGDVAKSARAAQNQLDEFMFELALSLVALRDRVAARERLIGNPLQPVSGRPSFTVYSGNLFGGAICADFKGFSVPLARLAVRDTYEECLIHLWAITNDSAGLAEAARVAEYRRVLSTIKAAQSTIKAAQRRGSR